MPVDAKPDTYKELTSEGSVFVDFWGPRCQPRFRSRARASAAS